MKTESRSTARAFDFGEANLFAQLILAGPGGLASLDPNDSDGLGGSDLLLASVIIPVVAQNPGGTFLQNLATAQRRENST